MIQDILQNYINSISSKFTHEETSEMGYRTDFEILLKGVFESINVTRFDHDARAKQGNKPDFVVIKDDVPILYIETKDIGVSLDKIEKSEQMSRYFGYANLVLTDYVEFRFYRNGLPYGEPIKIAEYNKSNRTIASLPNNFDYLAKTLVDFTQSHKEPIKSGKHLSKIMGGKAQRIRDNVRQFLAAKSDRNAELTRVYETIKKLLVHDLTEEAFADMYAQTLVYGLFVARFYDESPTNFTRQEARDLIPESNPLLRHFFDHIVGPNFDKRLEYIVNELCEVFSHADVEKLMSEYLTVNLKGKTHRRQDTVIHFYEDFLNEYDPALRKRMGAYYTPLPVVEFIVRSVDQSLIKDFGLPRGLADTAKLTDGKHRVQVLDPAVGTGTFISAIIGEIYRKFDGQQGRWPAYVLHDLLPRIHGFELMMAPYTIAHLKLGMAFKETGFKYFNNRRLGIYLTNSLENTPEQEDLFNAFGLAESIAEESKEAAVIKNKTPVMVVIGNPPYSGHSSNNTKYANSLVDKYKFEVGGTQKLQERNAKWLNDDYVKFIALAENMIARNGSGIIAMITNNGYLDNPTFRGMRWHLAKTFDKIYVLDLHGNAKKKESAPDGSKDENVFDIMQGVGIILAVKSGAKQEGKLSEVYHSEFYGTRKDKFSSLFNKTIDWLSVELDEKFCSFIPNKSPELQSKYDSFVGITNLFHQNTLGFQTHRDDFAITDSREVIDTRISDLLSTSTDGEISSKYDLHDNRDWHLSNARERLRAQTEEQRHSLVQNIAYRLFDTRITYFDETFSDYPRTLYKTHVVGKDNLVLGVGRQGLAVGSIEWGLVTIAKTPMDANIFRRGGVNAFPLYLYTDDRTRIANINKELAEQLLNGISFKAGNEIIPLRYNEECKERDYSKAEPYWKKQEVYPLDLLDYVYSILHSTKYRQKYKEFLKIDFPRVPKPTSGLQFWKLVELGRELRVLHLLESPKVNEFITIYPESGSDVIDRSVYKDGKVYINEKQYFGNVPEVAWNFYIGGYQPAQKWLKDRKGDVLTNEDLEHYQKIIVVLTETDRIMREIDQI